MTFTQIMNEYGVLLMSVVVILIIGFLLRMLFKEADKKKSTLGKIINDHFVNQFETWLTIVMILLWVTESLIAASIHPVGVDGLPEQQINGVARFMSHFGTALVGIIGVIALPRFLVEFIESFETISQKKGKALAWSIFFIVTNLLMLLIVLYVTIRVPYYNIELIAKGLNELDNVNYAWYELTFRSIDYPRLGLPSDYDPWDEMGFQMYASLLLLICHYVISIWDGITVLRREAEKKVNFSAVRNTSKSRDYSPSDNEVDDIANNPIEAIKSLLRKTGTIKPEDLDERADHLKEIFLTLPHVEEHKRDNVRTKISGDMAVLVKKWEKFRNDTAGMSSKLKQQHRQRIINETRDLFARKEGFNYQLPGN